MTDVASEYKTSYQNLKDMKIEIEHLHHLLDQARHRLTRDFEHWFSTVYMPTSSQEVLDIKRSIDRHDSGKDIGFDIINTDKEKLSAPNAGRKAVSEVVRPCSRASRNTSSPFRSKVDEDIAAFYKARDELLKNNK